MTVLMFTCHTNIDESEVTSPISIADWLRDFYPIAAKHPSCIRGVCHEGEVMYIPSGTLQHERSNSRMVAPRSQSLRVNRGHTEFRFSSTFNIRPPVSENKAGPDIWFCR